jgi:acetyl-CoA carboxylase biotin carboxyl carrier protein
MDITHDDVKKILEIVDSARELDEVDLSYGGFHLRIHRGAGPAAGSREPMSAVALKPARPSSPAALAEPALWAPAQAEQALGAGEIAIRAPMLGTFYRSPAPGEPPFVEIGQRIRADDTLCLIEVMKLFSSIKAGAAGVVKQILPANGDLVEFDQILIVIGTGA